MVSVGNIVVLVNKEGKLNCVSTARVPELLVCIGWFGAAGCIRAGKAGADNGIENDGFGVLRTGLTRLVGAPKKF
jgi:hypothetical protein